MATDRSETALKALLLAFGKETACAFHGLALGGEADCMQLLAGRDKKRVHRFASGQISAVWRS
jgi:hypothetical protein